MSLPQLVVDGDVQTVRYALTELSTEEIDGQRLNGLTVLMLACEQGHIEIVHLLLEKEVNVNLQGYNNHTVLSSD